MKRLSNSQIINVMVPSGTTALDSLHLMQEGGLQILLIVDEDNRLIGILTDGDIRRGLLQGIDLSDSVDLFMKRDYLYGSILSDPNIFIEIMKSNGLKHLPILNEHECVTELLLASSEVDIHHFPNTVVIMAGGKGTRLQPLTNNCPKPMLLVNGKPMLEILIDIFKSDGFTKFYISVNYLKEQIIDYFGDGSSRSISITYLEEEKPLGTAGSLTLLPQDILHPIVVINGDILTRVNFPSLLKFHHEHNASITLCAREHLTTIPFGVVNTNGVELNFITEKPVYRHFVNAGIYVLDRSIAEIQAYPGYLSMTDLLMKKIDEGLVVNFFPLHEYWLDIGQISDYNRAQLDIEDHFSR